MQGIISTGVGIRDPFFEGRMGSVRNMFTDGPLTMSLFFGDLNTQDLKPIKMELSRNTFHRSIFFVLKTDDTYVDFPYLRFPGNPVPDIPQGYGLLGLCGKDTPFDLLSVGQKSDLNLWRLDNPCVKAESWPEEARD
jgi:hypothetical protein